MFTMNYTFLVLLISTLIAVLKSEGPEFFRTNIDEYEDHPIFFDRPIPTWIRGTLIRNGIGRFEFGDRKVTNALDASAKLSSWKFPGNGSVFFSTKMIQSDSYKQSVIINDFAPYLLGAPTDPPFSTFEQLEAFRNGLDNMNVNVLNYTNSATGESNFVVVSDCWKSYEFDPRTLDTIGPVMPDHPGHTVFDAPLPLSSGHPMPEPGTTNHLTFLGVSSMEPLSKPHFRLIRIKASHDRELIATVELEKLSYLHSFPVTQHYAILPSLPLFIELKDLSPLDAFSFDPTAPTEYHVINLKTGTTKTIKGDNLFYLHAINAYEVNNNEIVMDFAVYKDGSALLTLNMTKLDDVNLRATAATSVLKRVHLDLQSETTTVETFPTKPHETFIQQLEYPTINEHYRYKQYCYIFGIAFNVNHTDFLNMAVVKKDICTGNDKYWYSENKYYNEAWFEARPGATTEDDGVLILPIFDKVTQQTNLTIFDAKDLTIISSAPLPTSNPFGTHGRFFHDIY